MKRAFPALAFLLASAAAAAACQPTAIDTAANALLRAEAVFVGSARAMSVIETEAELPASLRAAGARFVSVELKIDEVWKGAPSAEAISVNMTLCDGPFVVGVPYVFVISKRERKRLAQKLPEDLRADRMVLIARDWMIANDPSYIEELRTYIGRLERGAPYAEATNGLTALRKRFNLRP